MKITIKESLYKKLKDYCNLNGIDIESFCNNAIDKELMEQKYGDIPFGVIGKEEKKELPSIHIEENEIPTTPIANEIIPIDKPFNKRDETSVLIGMDEITSVEKLEKKEENKEKTKNKRRRL